MSMMDPDDEQPGIPDHIRQDADLLLERWQQTEDKMRLLGLYIEGEPQIAMIPGNHPGFGPPRVGLAVNFTVGKVAFSDRVQFPEQEDFNKEARKMEVTFKDDQFLDERERIRKGLAEGKSMEEIMLEGLDDDDD